MDRAWIAIAGPRSRIRCMLDCMCRARCGSGVACHIPARLHTWLGFQLCGLLAFWLCLLLVGRARSAAEQQNPIWKTFCMPQLFYFLRCPALLVSISTRFFSDDIMGKSIRCLSWLTIVISQIFVEVQKIKTNGHKFSCSSASNALGLHDI